MKQIKKQDDKIKYEKTKPNKTRQSENKIGQTESKRKRGGTNKK